MPRPDRNVRFAVYTQACGFVDSLVRWWLRMIHCLERRTQPRVLHNLMTPPFPAITKIAIEAGTTLLVFDDAMFCRMHIVLNQPFITFTPLTLRKCFKRILSLECLQTKMPGHWTDWSWC